MPEAASPVESCFVIVAKIGAPLDFYSISAYRDFGAHTRRRRCWRARQATLGHSRRAPNPQDRSKADMNPDDELVCLRKAMNPAEAHMVEQALRANGIEGRVVGDFLEAGLGNIPGLQAEVWVKKRDLAAAHAALASAETLMAPDPANEEES